MTWLRRTVSISVAAVFGIAVSCLLGLGPADASTVPGGPTDPQFCTDYGQASAGEFDGILACTGPNIGAIKFHGANGAIITSDTVGFQCVELAARYLYSQFRLPVQYVNG